MFGLMVPTILLAAIFGVAGSLYGIFGTARGGVTRSFERVGCGDVAPARPMRC